MTKQNFAEKAPIKVHSKYLNIGLNYSLFSNVTFFLKTNDSIENLYLSKFPNSTNSNLSIKIDIFNKTLCPMIPVNLSGRIPVNTNFDGTFDDLENSLSNLGIEKGGSWSPKECNAKYKKQQIEYGIYLVEPLQNLTFNRGLLMNIGFIESLKQTNETWECFIFHDVDLIPEDDRNIYSCPEQPRHMSSAVSTFNYRLPYDGIFGGVSALTKEQMEKVNGYSNLYFGWGGEDDDFRTRIVKNNFKISRYPLEIGRYYMAGHTRDQEINSERFKLLNAAVTRMKTDGLNSLEYRVNDTIISKLFTKVVVSYDQNGLLKKKY
ncbi:unnamed protein product [Brachionus calyciflorus]|uniref:Beta-1,4-galactosyltransferase n=1 Tax=Brachionus calyciflorus TaxID=104777 RepID=A0A813T510_9BILA|nr:unnamed protein product [Brachionus calyciflorus]